ncbi:MAG TPA: phosphatidate cytidylyltransferase [Bacteroidia bacterium]|nr:phosphatidate cytidylyltransferase [Bacteroidia bacterium]
MNEELINLLIIGGCFLLLFAVGEFLFHVVKIKGEYTRKFIHIVTGFLTLLFPLFFSSHWYVLILCAAFAIILQVSLKIDFLLRSINTIDRKSFGSVSYPAAVYGAFLFARYSTGSFEDAFYYIPVLTLAVCDPVAAIVGRNFPWKPYRAARSSKTWAGTLVFFISAAVLGFFLLTFLTDTTPMNCVIIALSLAFVTAAAEAMSRYGLDNLFVPAAAILVLYFFANYTPFYQSLIQ